MGFSKVTQALGVAGLVVSFAIGACGGDESGTEPEGSGSGPPGPSGGGTCTCALKPECSSVESECAAQADNASSGKAGLRINQLTITKPAAFANGIVGVVAGRAAIPALPQCYLAGDGTFSWLLEFDKATGALKTGGAKPSTADKGYCFVNETLAGKTIAPITLQTTLKDGSGAFTAQEGQNVTVPIYLDDSGKNFVLLPLHAARIVDGNLSADGNCIGKHNSDGLLCVDQCKSTDEIPSFLSGAKLEGFITLEEADTVEVEAVNGTLCGLLAGGTGGKCKRDANDQIEFKGDWCEATNAPATAECADSVLLGAEIAAGAVKILGDCQ